MTKKIYYIVQPSQKVPAAGDFAAYNEMSAVYFIVKFTNNKLRSLLLPTTPAILPTTQKHFDWADCINLLSLVACHLC